MGAVVDWRGATRTLCRDKPNVSTTWVHSTETSVSHSKSSAMWPGQMCQISLPMGRDRITCLPLRREPQGTLLKSAHSLHSLEACDVYTKRVPTQWNGYQNCLWNCESVPNEQQLVFYPCYARTSIDAVDARIVSNLARSDNPYITWVVWCLARSETPNIVVTPCAPAHQSQGSARVHSSWALHSLWAGKCICTRRVNIVLKNYECQKYEKNHRFMRMRTRT